MGGKGPNGSRSFRNFEATERGVESSAMRTLHVERKEMVDQAGVATSREIGRARSVIASRSGEV